MRAIPVMVIAVVVGWGVVFHFAGVGWFAKSTWQFHSQNVLAYALIFVVATMGVPVQPKAVRSVVMALSLPTVLFSSLMLLGLITEGGWSWVTRGWGWVVLILEVIGVASVGAAIGYYVPRRKGTGS